MYDATAQADRRKREKCVEASKKNKREQSLQKVGKRGKENKKREKRYDLAPKINVKTRSHFEVIPSCNQVQGRNHLRHRGMFE